MNIDTKAEFESGHIGAFRSCREYVAFCVSTLGRFQKTIAADMDISPSVLSRKLSQYPGDTRRFGVDDLELYLETQHDARPLKFLINKFSYLLVEDPLPDVPEIHVKAIIVEGVENPVFLNQ